MKQKIVVAMSGGVDSSVSAYLLKEKYDVIGLFMNNWDDPNSTTCSATQDWIDVLKVGQKLKIPCYSINFSKEYYDNVFETFLKELKLGKTPNPDVLCNKKIKFEIFKKYAFNFAPMLATGHYANYKDNKLYTAKDENKDQTYFLNQVKSNNFNNVIFPLANLTKAEVRTIAKKNGFSTADKKDSTGICFIGEKNFKNFLKNYLTNKEGDIIDEQGNYLGKHQGLYFYTLGQRRGLNIGGVKNKEGRWYVIKKDIDNNILIVSNKKAYYSKEIFVNNFNYINYIPQRKEFNAYSKFRYRQKYQEVSVRILDNSRLCIIPKEEQRAITEGQFAVLYLKDEYNDIEYDCLQCIGGGEIVKIF